MHILPTHTHYTLHPHYTLDTHYIRDTHYTIHLLCTHYTLRYTLAIHTLYTTLSLHTIHSLCTHYTLSSHSSSCISEKGRERRNTQFFLVCLYLFICFVSVRLLNSQCSSSLQSLPLINATEIHSHSLAFIPSKREENTHSFYLFIFWFCLFSLLFTLVPSLSSSLLLFCRLVPSPFTSFYLILLFFSYLFSLFFPFSFQRSLLSSLHYASTFYINATTIHSYSHPFFPSNSNQCGKGRKSTLFLLCQFISSQYIFFNIVT